MKLPATKQSLFSVLSFLKTFSEKLLRPLIAPLGGLWQHVVNKFFWNLFSYFNSNTFTIAIRKRKVFYYFEFISLFKYIRMPPLSLPVFLSWCIESKFDKWKFELFLKSLSVDHVFMQFIPGSLNNVYFWALVTNLLTVYQGSVFLQLCNKIQQSSLACTKYSPKCILQQLP